MASGDTTASTPVVCTGATATKTAVDALNLAAATDQVVVASLGNGQNLVFKIERAA
jgi:hypothetical protein